MERTTTLNDLLKDTGNAAPEVGPTQATLASRRRRGSATKMANDRPMHCKVSCMSMETRELDAKAAEYKKRGLTSASKWRLLRVALRSLSISALSGDTEGDLMSPIEFA